MKIQTDSPNFNRRAVIATALAATAVPTASLASAGPIMALYRRWSLIRKEIDASPHLADAELRDADRTLEALAGMIQEAPAQSAEDLVAKLAAGTNLGELALAEDAHLARFWDEAAQILGEAVGCPQQRHKRLRSRR